MKKRTAIENLWTIEPIKKGMHVNVITVSGASYIGKVIRVISQSVNSVENWFNVVEVEEIDESEISKNGGK